VGREGEREGGRDSVTLPKGVCAVQTCKGVSGLPPRAMGGGVLGEEREWGPWGSSEPWRRGDNSEEGVVVTAGRRRQTLVARRESARARAYAMSAGARARAISARARTCTRRCRR